MEILNTELIYSDIAEILVMLGFFPVIIFGLMLFLKYLYEEKAKGMIIGIAVIIAGFLMMVYGDSMPKITTYDVILTDKSYYELIEEYEILNTEGKIITIAEKGE